MTYERAYKEYLTGLKRRHPGKKVALSYDKWLPLYKAGLA